MRHLDQARHYCGMRNSVQMSGIPHHLATGQLRGTAITMSVSDYFNGLNERFLGDQHYLKSQVAPNAGYLTSHS
jgi:hypothetical protein